MPVNEAVVKELIKTAEDARALTLKQDGRPGMPLDKADKLDDLPKHLQPYEDGESQCLVRSIVGFQQVASWDGRTEYEAIITLYKSSDDIPGSVRHHPGVMTGTWNDEGKYGFNYREMIEKLNREHSANHPSCCRVTLEQYRHGNCCKLVVHGIDVYAGDDLETARGLLVSCGKLHVTDDKVMSALAMQSKLGIYRYRNSDLIYAPNRGKVEKKVVARRIEKGQMPIDLVRRILRGMTDPMGTLGYANGLTIDSSALYDRKFAAYVTRVISAYPIFLLLVKSKDRVSFREALREAKAYVPGLLRSKATGRATLGRWLKKTIRKEC